MFDWITGEKFIEIADLVYRPEGVKDCTPLENTFCICALKEKNIVYTHTMYVKRLFEIIRKIPLEFIIISHNCDENVDSSFEIPDNVIRWYSQNVNYTHPRLESIPIGLENSRWFKDVDKKGKMLKKLETERKIKNLLYMNHNIATCPSERQQPYNWLEGRQWVTSERGSNGKRFEEYLDNIYRHRFVLCPRGNGIDTHRTWETLYMGSFPVEKRNINNQFYTDLPICFVDDWEEITIEFLKEEYFKRLCPGEWNMDKLNFSYWKNKILSNV